MRLYIFDDAVADGWRPFALSRPVGELRFGAMLQRRRLERFAGAEARGHLSRPWLVDFTEPGAPPVLDRDDGPEELSTDAPRLLLSSRLVPPPDPASPVSRDGPDGGVRLTAGGEPAGFYLPPGTEAPDPEVLSDPSSGRLPAIREVGGGLLAAPWDLVHHGPDRLAADIEAMAPPGSRRDPASLPEGVWLRGGHPAFIAHDVRLEPGTLLDTRQGPVWLDAGVEVRAGTRIAGPFFAGARSRLLGGALEASSLGPVSYVRGEVSESILLGHVNKAHDGYLGHACLGRWVNLGAGTTNSDLKNNYGPVRIGGPDGPVETGLLKLGCLLGDHVKTAIGTLLTTGSVVGTGANLFGPASPSRWTPPFAWGGGETAARYRKDDFLDTTRTVMGRRDAAFGPDTARWLEAVWERARQEEEIRRRKENSS